MPRLRARTIPNRKETDLRKAWWMLALLALAELLGMSLWFTASATAAQLTARWGLGAGGAASLVAAVQIGFVAGTAIAALLNLADVVVARRYFAASALLAAAANASLLLATGVISASVSRFLTGFFLAGVYPPAMKMAASWFRRSRGLAIGIVVGALTIGKALPYLIGAVGTPAVRLVALATSAGAVFAAVLVFAVWEDGPHAFERRPFSWLLTGTIARHRHTRLAIAGYLGHMWELYAMWALVAAFFFDFFLARELTAGGAATRAGFVGFCVIAMGGIGSVVAGAWADRLGRERVTIAAMAVSGACSLVIGWLAAAPLAVVVLLALVWGFAIVADSAQFSAIVTEVAPPHAVGTALTLQTSLGFALTAASIWLTAEIAGRVGWGPAFSMLAIGPLLGIVAMARLKNTRLKTASDHLSRNAT
ncbi:MAG: MFS transporter [Gemmatimonadota bacterium]